MKGDKLSVSLFLISLLTSVKEKKDYCLPPLLDCDIRTALADVDVYFLLQGIVDVGRFAAAAAATLAAASSSDQSDIYIAEAPKCISALPSTAYMFCHMIHLSK